MKNISLEKSQRIEALIQDDVLKKGKTIFGSESAKYERANSPIINLLVEILSHQEEIICSPLRFNGVHVDHIISTFKKYGIEIDEEF